MKSFNNFNEAVKGQDTESRKEGAKERAADKKSGKIRKNTLDPKDYATQQKKVLSGMIRELKEGIHQVKLVMFMK